MQRAGNGPTAAPLQLCSGCWGGYVTQLRHNPALIVWAATAASFDTVSLGSFQHIRLMRWLRGGCASHRQHCS